MRPGTPLVAVLVGTDHHPFDRMVSWAAHLVDAGPAKVFVQHGTTPLPVDLDGAPMLGPAGLRDLLVDADAVVCHGGPGLIMEARAAGHRPVVVARNSTFGEHVDDHQQRFVRFACARGLIVEATTCAEMCRAVEDAVAVRGPQPDPALVGPGAARFGDLVDAMLRRS